MSDEALHNQEKSVQIHLSQLKVAVIALSAQAQSVAARLIDYGLNGRRPTVAEFYRITPMTGWPQQLTDVLREAHCIVLVASYLAEENGVTQRVERRILEGTTPCILVADRWKQPDSHLKDHNPESLAYVAARGEVDYMKFKSIFGAIPLINFNDERKAAPEVMGRAVDLAVDRRMKITEMG